MKITPFYRIFIWLAIIASFVIAYLAYTFQHHEKDVFLSILQYSLKQNISASDVDYDFPFGFSLDDVKIGGYIQADKLTTQFDLTSIGKNKIILTELVLHRPIVIWHKSARGRHSADENPITVSQYDGKDKSENDLKLFIKKFHIVGGRFHFADETSVIPITFRLDDLLLQADALIFPFEPNTTTFQFSARLIKNQAMLSGSMIKSDGWIDFARRNMDSQIFVVEKDDRVGLSAHVVSKNNDVKVLGKVRAKNLIAADHLQKLEGKLDNFVLGTLSNMGVEIGANFSFETKLDDFRVEEISFSGSVSSNPVAE